MWEVCSRLKQSAKVLICDHIFRVYGDLNLVYINVIKAWINFRIDHFGINQFKSN